MQLAMMFKDGMVLQRDRLVNIWGTAETGSEIRISMQGRSASATADQDGKFLVEAGPFTVSDSEQMVIACGEEQIELNNVAVGEVWLAGGQSNMEFYMRYDRDIQAEKDREPNLNLRFFDYPEVSYVGELQDADYSGHYGFWRTANAEDMQWWSAVPYYFAKDLYERYQVPIGVIGCNWGGTTASCWIPESVIREAGGQVIIDDYRKQTAGLDLETYNKTFAANPMNFRTNQLTGQGHELQDWIMSGDYGNDLMIKMAAKIGEMLQAQGMDPSKVDPSVFLPQDGPKSERRPGGLYESMLCQVAPYTIRGVIYYQGESDGDVLEYANIYHKIFAALIGEWRRIFGQPDMPFLFVQIASFHQWLESKGDNYGIIRRAQQWVADHVANTGMAVITDNGMPWDIHPIVKHPVGHRLALLAENKVYGEENVLCEAPTLTGVTAEEGKIILKFDNAGDGLHFSYKTMYGEELEPGSFGGLSITQNKKEIDMTTCQCAAEGSKVIVESSQIRGGVPTEVQIAQDTYYMVNLYNSGNIPARPVEL